MKEWLSLEKWKSFGVSKWMLCLLAGIFLLVLCIPTEKNRKDIGSLSTEEEIEKTDIDDLEQRLQEMLEKVQGVGRVEVMITTTGEYNQIEGVVVVAEGGNTPQVRQDITETAQALFPIAAHKIKVCKMVE